MNSKPSTRQNSLDRTQGSASDQASSISGVSNTSSKGSKPRSRQSSASMSSRASSFSQKSAASSRRNSTDNQSIVSMNESLFSRAGSVASVKTTASANSVKSGVIADLYDKFRDLDALNADRNRNFESAPIAVEEATVHRSGRAGVRQYVKRSIEKIVDPAALDRLMDGYKPSERTYSKSYKLRCKHKDAARGTDQLVVEAGIQSGLYVGSSMLHHTFGKRQQERRDFAKVADNLGLRPGTLDQCDIKKVMNGKVAANDKQKNAVWNAFHEPNTFHEGIEEAASNMTGGITGLSGGAQAKPIDEFTERLPRTIRKDGGVALGKVHGEVYQGHKRLGEGKLRRNFTRMSNKMADMDAGIGVGIQKEKVMIDGNGKVTRKSQERKAGRLPESDDVLEQMLEGTWRKATPRKPSSVTKSEA